METLLTHRPRKLAGRPEGEIAEQWLSRGSDVTRGLLGGRYEFRKRLGVGGMSQVFLAWDLRLQREVAVKMLRTEFVRNPYEVSRFLIEGQLLARIESDHIVQIFDMFSDDAHCYLVLERVQGANLEDAVAKRGALAMFDALQITRDMLLALADLHRQGVIHRDIKPSNILVGENHAMLLDLGVASDVGSPGFTQPHQTVGTPGYMSPEQRATGYVDARSDLFQLGLVLLFALTGVDLPAARHNFADALAKVPGELRPILEKVLAEDPEDRYQNAGEMLSDVQVWSTSARTVEIAIVDSAAIAAHLAKQAAASIVPPPAPSSANRRLPVLVMPSGQAPVALPANNARVARFAAMGAAMAAAAVALVAGIRSPGAAEAEAAPIATVERIVAPIAKAAPQVPAVPAPPAKVEAKVTATVVPQGPVARTQRVARDGNVGFVRTSSKDAARAFANAATGTKIKAAPPTHIETAPAADSPGAAILVAARANERNGAQEVAIAGFRRYLRQFPDAPDIAEVRAHLTSLESGRTGR